MFRYVPVRNMCRNISILEQMFAQFQTAKYRLMSMVGIQRRNSLPMGHLIWILLGIVAISMLSYHIQNLLVLDTSQYSEI